MTTQRDYYDILEVPRGANEEEIRKAFRKKALEFHPDRNKAADAADRFKQVNTAYQVLNDPEQRQQYDRFGHAGVGHGAGAGAPQGFEGADLFGGFGDIFDAFFSSGVATGRARPGRDLEAAVTIGFEEAAFGAPKVVDVERTERCERCNGTRAEPGHTPRPCATCRGTGRLRRSQRSIFGQFVTEMPCDVCGGAGQTVSMLCTGCKGSGVQTAKRPLKFDVPAGVEEGMRLTLEHQGDAGQDGGPPGDVHIAVHVQPHEVLRREGTDIVYTLPLSFPEAALGTEVQVPTLEGSRKLRVPAGTQSGSVFTLKGLGVPHLMRKGYRGDQVVRVRVATPQRLSKRQRELLEELRRAFTEDGAEAKDRSRG